MSLLKNSVQPVSEAFLRQLNQAFGQRMRVQQNVTTIQDVMYDAGQKDMLQWINNWVSQQKGVASDPEGKDN